MLAFTTPLRPAFRREAGTATDPARPDTAVEPICDPPTLRPAVELETRLLLRDLGWNR